MSARHLWLASIAVLVLSLAAQFAVAWHPHFALERLLGFNAVYGFTACAVLIVVAKGIGLLLKRRDDYYDE